MIRLLKIEWDKIYYYKTTRVFTLIYFGMLVMSGVILSFIKPTIGGVKLDIVELGMFNFPVIWQNITYLVAIMKIFLAVIIITNVTNEFSNRTLKQNLIDGLSKKEFLGSKILTNVVFASLSSIFVLGICLVLGFVFSKTDVSFIKGMEYMLAYFLKLNLFFSLCLFLSILLRKSAFAFLGLIVLWMAEAIISTIEVLLKAWLDKGFENITPGGFFISNYLPLNTSSKLIEIPLDLQGFVMEGGLFKLGPIDWTFSLSAIVYILIFSYLSYFLLKKRDL